MNPRFIIYESQYYKKIHNELDKCYIGPWCFDNWKNETQQIDNWDDVNILPHSIEYIKKLTLKIINALYSNSENTNDFSNEEFINIYYSWTFSMLFRLQANWINLDKFNENDFSYLINVEYTEVISNNLNDNYFIYNFDLWNYYIIGEILKFKNVSLETFDYKKKNIVKKKILSHI